MLLVAQTKQHTKALWKPLLSVKITDIQKTYQNYRSQQFINQNHHSPYTTKALISLHREFIKNAKQSNKTHDKYWFNPRPPSYPWERTRLLLRAKDIIAGDNHKVNAYQLVQLSTLANSLGLTPDLLLPFETTHT